MKDLISKAVIMDEASINRAIVRISHEIIEKNSGLDNLALIGIQRRGVTMARRIKSNLDNIEGVQVPMGETYPALLQIDYAFVKPNNKRIDLSGCFIVAKAEGDLSTERLQMSPHSISCYNKSGMYFKKDKLVGWAADTKDNDFALRAEVNLNQGRVAQSAFAKALIDGLGQSLERNTKSVGGKGIDDQSPSVVIKESGQQVGSMVADFYLSYLKGLRPTMKVTSGRDAWLVLGSDIELPYEFFKKEDSNENNFEFVTDLFR